MTIIYTILGCLLGVVLYLVIANVTPIDTWGKYSIGLLVAMCMIMVSVVSFGWERFRG